MDSPNDGTLAPIGFNNNQIIIAGPYVFGGSLYAMMTVGKFPSNTAQMYKSTDDGISWAQVDPAGALNGNGNFATAFDGLATIRTVYGLGDGFSTLGAAVYQDFDLTTETWGGQVAGGPSTLLVYGLTFFASGVWVAFLSENNFGPTPPTLRATTIQAGGAWFGLVDVTQNAYAEFPLNGLATPSAGWPAYCMNPDRTVCHVVFAHTCYFPAFPDEEFYFIYQQIDDTLGLSNYVPFGPRGLYPNDAEGVDDPPTPAVFGDNVVIAFSSQTIGGAQSVTVGKPLSAPVFTQFLNIDPQYAFPVPGNYSNDNGKLRVIGSRLWLVQRWTSTDGATPYNRMRVLQQTDNVNPGVGWLGLTTGAIFDGDTDGGPGWVPGSLISPQVFTDVNGGPSLTMNSGNTNADGLFISFFLQFQGVIPPLPSAPMSPKVGASAGRGGPTIQPFPTAPTFAGRSAFPVEAGKLAAEALGQLMEAKRGWPFPWIAPPCGAIRVTESHSIMVPNVNVLTELLLYTVELGFQFALVDIVVEHLHLGVRGADDPGSFLWSLTLNKPVGIASFQGSPVQGFASVDTGLGTLQDPWPLECPEIFNPNDAVRVEITNITLTPGSPKAPNYFKAFFLGWRWPVG